MPRAPGYGRLRVPGRSSAQALVQHGKGARVRDASEIGLLDRQTWLVGQRSRTAGSRAQAREGERRRGATMDPARDSGSATADAAAAVQRGTTGGALVSGGYGSSAA